jgi:uncharacterized membrane protein
VFQLLLFLHVLGAIVAFGFGFAAPVFGTMLAREPQHAGWYIRSVKRVSNFVIIPAALSMAVTGVGLVHAAGRRFEEPWLAASIVLYAGALLAVFLIQRPALDRLIELQGTPPGPEGPSPEIPRLAARLRLVGIGLTVTVTVILLLMVWRPTV